MCRLWILCYYAALMIAEIFPEHYDIHGRRVLNPGTRMRRFGFRPTAPMGSYLTQPLATRCKDFTEVRQFLSTCRGQNMSEFERRDHWQPPEEFEKTHTGDCVDFGLWAWRQILGMGYPARFVGGISGKYGEGHAWVTFEKDGRHFLLEPQLWIVGLRMPRISTLRYHPKASVGWDGKKILYFDHEDRDTEPSFQIVPSLVAEWLFIWSRFWFRFGYTFPLTLGRSIGSKLRRRKQRSQP
jgi:hypothetical protein